MNRKNLLSIFCWAMLALVPASLVAAGAGVGMAHPYGTAYLNGVAVDRTSTIFPGDLVQTSATSAMKISASGSSVTVLSGSLVKFEGGAVAVEHGGVKLVTGKSMAAHAGSVTVTPASNARTEYQMTDVNGKVQIVALKGDLQISNGSTTTVLPEGQQATPKSLGEVLGKATEASIPNNGGFLLAATSKGSTDAGAQSLAATTARNLQVQPELVNTKTISPKK